MNMRERELVKVVHTFSVDNGFVADKYAIQTAYRKHPMQNSIRCVSDVLDEIDVDHEVCSLEKCSGIDFFVCSLRVQASELCFQSLPEHFDAL